MIRKTIYAGLALGLCLGLFSCSASEDTPQSEYSGNPNSGANPGLRFIAVGDVGRGNSNQYRVAAAMKDKCIKDNCDFVILLGDNIYNDGVSSVNDIQFQDKFELPYKNINIPFYVALGNHDYGGNGTGTEYDKSVYQVDYTQLSSKWKMPRHYYRFEQQNVTLIALDTNGQMFGVDRNQRDEVSRWIAETTSQWKIAFGHHPYLSNGPHGNAGQYDGKPSIPVVNGNNVKQFADAIWCGKVDLYLSGHDHSRQWLQDTCQGTQIVVSGAGSGTTRLPGSNPVLFQANTLGFLYVTIQDKLLSAQFIDADGNVDFSHSITK